MAKKKQAAPKKEGKVWDGEWIAISIACASSVGYKSCAVAVQVFTGTVIAETEKAIKVKADEDPRALNSGQTIWLPKRALVKVEGREYFALAKWFRPDSYQRRVFAGTHVACLQA